LAYLIFQFAFFKFLFQFSISHLITKAVWLLFINQWSAIIDKTYLSRMFLKRSKLWIYLRYGLVLLSILFLSLELISLSKHLNTHKGLLYESLFSVRIIWVLPLLLLMPINWMIEALKWKKVLKTLFPIKFKASLFGVIAGTSTGVITPNRLGEFAGRIMYLPAIYRAEAIGLNFVCSFSQLWATVFFGTFAVGLFSDILQPGTTHQIAYGLISVLGFVMLISLGLFIFKLKWLSAWVIKKGIGLKWVQYFSALANMPKSLIVKLLFLSLIRYLVFLIQHLIAIKLFSPLAFSFYEAAALIAMVYFFSTLLPVNSFLELGIRAGATLHLWNLAMPHLAVAALIASLFIWVLNVALPALLGNFILLKINPKQEIA